MISIMKRSYHVPPPNRHFSLSAVLPKDNWDTKDDTGKSIKNALISGMPKGTSQAKTVEKSCQ